MIRKSRTAGILGVGTLAALVIMFGSIACKQAEKTTTIQELAAQAKPAQEVNAIKEGVNEITGTVKSALGKYFYIGQLPGFDIVAEGQVDTGDATALLGKDVVVKAFFNREKPSLLLAQSIEIKEGAGLPKSVFNKAESAVPGDFFDQKTRPEFQEIKITALTKSADWEGKGKGKVFGKLLAGADGKSTAISVLDDSGKEKAKIIVDSLSEYASYSTKKLRLFDSCWFYFSIKDSVEPKLRAKAKEVFHADVVFSGLY